MCWRLSKSDSGIVPPAGNVSRLSGRRQEELKMKHLAAIALTFTIIAAPAVAGDDPQLGKAEIITMTLTPILGSEKACGLKYDVDVIKDFIVKHIDADNAYFPDLLETGTRVRTH
jgi:hypothetical protein